MCLVLYAVNCWRVLCQKVRAFVWSTAMIMMMIVTMMELRCGFIYIMRRTDSQITYLENICTYIHTLVICLSKGAGTKCTIRTSCYVHNLYRTMCDILGIFQRQNWVDDQLTVRDLFAGYPFDIGKKMLIEVCMYVRIFLLKL